MTASPVCCKAKNPRTWHPINRKIGKLRYCVSWLWSISTNKSKGCAAKNPCHIAYVSIVSPLSPGPVFLLNFSSAGKGSFMASKAKICPGGALSWGRGVVEWHVPTPGGAKFFETSFSHFKTSFPQISHCYLKTAIYPNNLFYAVFNVLFPKCVAHKRKSCVYLRTFPYIHSFPWSDRITTCIFFKTTYLILVNLEAVAGGKKCGFKP